MQALAWDRRAGQPEAAAQIALQLTDRRRRDAIRKDREEDAMSLNSGRSAANGSVCWITSPLRNLVVHYMFRAEMQS